MKKIKDNARKLKSLSADAASNGHLDEKTVDSALDRMLKAAEEINRELDALLAKARTH